MKTLLFLIARVSAVIAPIFLFVGSTEWFCDRLVGSSDPIMHPFIYLGPIALILGAFAAWICFMIVADQEARRHPSDKEKPKGE
ncbi:MAG: hypothetical protein KDB00_26695 [Planctomycetales bacterium]|nr:hypothetical protein [Planctomycetales bacterium]